jgi:hypothetical protein
MGFSRGCADHAADRQVDDDRCLERRSSTDKFKVYNAAGQGVYVSPNDLRPEFADR